MGCLDYVLTIGLNALVIQTGLNPTKIRDFSDYYTQRDTRLLYVTTPLHQPNTLHHYTTPLWLYARLHKLQRLHASLERLLLHWFLINNTYMLTPY